MSNDSISMDRLGRQLVFTAKATSARFDRLLGEAGSSLSHFVLLSGLQRTPGLSQRELATFAGLEGSTVTHHLDRLEREGAIVRTRDTADRRVVRVTLSPAGEALLARLTEVADGHDAVLHAGLGARDAASLRRILAKVQTVFEEDA